ncbi:MAG: DUF4124 domain-containing protein [Pseudomonadota bacterium]
MTSPSIQRQRGSFNLYWVAILSALFAAVAMAALWSWRYEKNVFAEGAAKVGASFKASPASGALDSALSAAAGKGDGKLRKCTIKGKTVVSNQECLDSNPTTRTMSLTDTRGVEPPRAPPAAAPEPARSNPMIDKAIEKQLR